jgi:hypothetical protein
MSRLIRFPAAKEISEVSVPGSAREVAARAFAHCRRLEGIRFDSLLETVGFGAFMCCEALKSINFRKGVLLLGRCAFTLSGKLEEVVTPDSCRGYRFSKPFLIDVRKQSIIMAVASGEHLDINIPDCSSLASWAMAYNKSKSIFVESPLIRISPYAFWNSDVESIALPRTLEEIDDSAFYGCRMLRDVRLNSKPIIAKNAFNGSTFAPVK